MTFKDTSIQFQMLDVTLIEPDPAHPRQQIDETSLKGLANAIAKKGLIHPLVVQPADSGGRYRLIVGERRWRAAQLAGEQRVPALIHACPADEVLEVRIFENLGLGVRAALEPRDMANAIQNIAQRFETPEAAADHFGRSSAWLSQATAAANLSPKVSALLDSGKIASTGAAIQLEKLAQKNEARAETLIVQTAQLPEGEKLAKKVIDSALSEEGGRRRKKEEAEPEAAPAAAAPVATAPATASIPPWEEAPAAPVTPPAAPRQRVNPGKVKMVAELLGLDDGDEEEILVRLIDEFLALKGEGNA
ncbi:ParB/RepB/Spo0J family partition protein [Dechloromonas hortensis]|uniref:ParB/RepB/Spo0J family partition protein n=1 Tax=Dechloromonas hortensis TaxID=337779 RepID=UPI00129203E0|nr:ParB/RepB/Spo0J family partition protein [Dechloromonas hortensis]